MKYTTSSLKSLAMQSKLFVGFALPGQRQTTSLDYLSTAVFYSKLSPADIGEVISSTPWQTGSIYPAISPTQGSLVSTAGGDVYICIHSTGQASVISPQGTEQSWPSDGYGWQYVGKVKPEKERKFGWHPGVEISGISDLSSFGILNYETAPLSSLLSTPCSSRIYPLPIPHTLISSLLGYPRGVVHQRGVAKPGKDRTYAVVEPLSSPITSPPKLNLSLSSSTGQIDAVNIVAAGSGISSASIKVFGDGTGAVLTPVLTAGVLTAVTISSPGTGYSWADAIVVSSQGVALRGISLDTESLLASKTVISKTVSEVPGVNSSRLTAFLAVSEESQSSSLLAGNSREQNSGDGFRGGLSVFSRLGDYGAIDPSQPVQINTVISQ